LISGNTVTISILEFGYGVMGNIILYVI
jgi:hypothetical protein